MSTNEAKPTPGPWQIGTQDKPIGYFPIYARIGVTQLARICTTDAHEVGYGISEAEHRANARLIAEAGTVYTETGLTPRELAEQRVELMKALDDITELEGHTRQGGPYPHDLEEYASALEEALSIACAALAKTEGEAK